MTCCDYLMEKLKNVLSSFLSSFRKNVRLKRGKTKLTDDTQEVYRHHTTSAAVLFHRFRELGRKRMSTVPEINFSSSKFLLSRQPL